jgi:glycosyltransferase involved in cell wall biosynthesis
VARRYKILYLIPNLQQGGAERQILELISRLPPAFEPTLCVFDDRIHYREYLNEGEPRHVLGARRMGPAAYRRLVEVLRDEQPDILHTWRDHANFWGRLAARGLPIPIVITSVRNRALDFKNLLTERRFAARTDRVLANSEGVRRELVSRARVPAGKVQVIHNFIDLERFRPPTPAEREMARHSLHLGPGQVGLLLAGRIGLQKHHLGLALALGILKRRGELPDSVRVLLAGRRHSRLYAALLDPWLSLQGVREQVTYLGTISDMSAVYHGADVAVMPSLWEGLPNALLESLASGLPAVVSHAANIDGLVTEASGIEVPTFRHHALADALGRLIALPDEARRRMGAAGRAHIAARFDAGRVLADVVELYERLLAEKGMSADPAELTRRR